MSETNTTAPSRTAAPQPVRTLGIVGAGYIGGTLAKLAVAAGIDVVIANSRDPHTLDDLVHELGDHARAGTAAEAAAAGDLVVVTVPLKAVPSLDAAAFAGKVVLDTCNYYPQRDGQIAELDEERTTTSELVQRALPDSRVVKVFNNIGFRELLALAQPNDQTGRTVLAVASDDDDALERTRVLLDQLGYRAVPVGPLAEGWRYERDMPAYGLIYMTESEPPAPKRADEPELRAALAAATRDR